MQVQTDRQLDALLNHVTLAIGKFRYSEEIGRIYALPYSKVCL